MEKNTVRFLREMPCSEVPAAEEMLNEMFPGFLGDDVLTRTKTEVQNLDTENTQNCISGIEFHLKPSEYHRARRGVQTAVDRSCIIIIIIAKKKKIDEH